MSLAPIFQLPVEFQNILFNLELERLITTGSLALLVYDYSITFSEEVELIWTSSWSVMKCLFILNRYSAFADPLLLMSFTMFPAGSREFCLTSVKGFAWSSTIGILLAECILKLRTWAVWGKHKIITVILVLESIIACGASVFFIQEYLQGIKYIPFKLPNGACSYDFTNRLIFADFISILVSESTAIILLIIGVLVYFRHRETALMTRIVQDGLLYFLCILLTTIANVVTILLAPVEIHTILVIFQRVMHSILCSRVILQIRRVLAEPERERDETTLLALDSSFSGGYLDTCDDNLVGKAIELRQRYQNTLTSRRDAYV